MNSWDLSGWKKSVKSYRQFLVTEIGKNIIFRYQNILKPPFRVDFPIAKNHQTVSHPHRSPRTRAPGRKWMDRRYRLRLRYRPAMTLYWFVLVYIHKYRNMYVYIFFSFSARSSFRCGHIAWIRKRWNERQMSPSEVLANEVRKLLYDQLLTAGKKIFGLYWLRKWCGVWVQMGEKTSGKC